MSDGALLRQHGKWEAWIAARPGHSSSPYQDRLTRPHARGPHQPPRDHELACRWSRPAPGAGGRIVRASWSADGHCCYGLSLVRESLFRPGDDATRSPLPCQWRGPGQAESQLGLLREDFGELARITPSDSLVPQRPDLGVTIVGGVSGRSGSSPRRPAAHTSPRPDSRLHAPPPNLVTDVRVDLAHQPFDHVDGHRGYR